jgi:hypothetical protein
LQIHVQNQVFGNVVDSEERAHQLLREQHGVLPFCRRLIILHCSKLVGLAVFAAAMQGQDAIGWLFLGDLPMLHAESSKISCTSWLIYSAFKVSILPSTAVTQPVLKFDSDEKQNICFPSFFP